MSLSSETSCPLYSMSGGTFPPPRSSLIGANLQRPGFAHRELRDPRSVWAEGSQRLDWFTSWQKVLEWNALWAKWFVGGKLNVTYNCVIGTAHSGAPAANKAAIVGGRASLAIRGC